MISILILTNNEEQNLPRCLHALAWCDDVVVVDDYSTDNTVRIAQQYGARVYQRRFDHFAGQRNYALEQVDFKHEWILHLDADEVCTPELIQEIEQAIEDPSHDAYRIPSKMIFRGRWLRRAGMYPTYQVRLGRHPVFRFKQVGHGQREDIDPESVGTLCSPYEHHSFRGLDDWFQRHNRYSSDEAELCVKTNGAELDLAGLLSFDKTRRRRAAKALSYRLPFRPLLRFLYVYLFRLGFLEGARGFEYAYMLAIYEAMSDLKIKEQQGLLQQQAKLAGEPATGSRPTVLVVSQVYVPDPAAVGQYIHDAAAELASRGLRVVVLTSQAGYEDPTQKYAKREQRDGVEIRRLPLSSFGKSSIALRLLGAASFLSQVLVRSLLMKRPAGLLVSTSPPMCSMAAVLISTLRRVPIVYWAMDINPDQAIALKKVRPGSLAVRALDAVNRSILRRAARIVALDPYMAARLETKVGVYANTNRKPAAGKLVPRSPIAHKLAVIPPWSLEADVRAIEHDDNPFRREHHLDGKFVFMYSGNMSPAHPLDTILQAALHFRDRRDVVFMFIGGGLEKQKVEAFAERENLDNIRLLPYQPFDQIRYSLSAADVHLVSMGDDMVGIVHPCKVYGAMACSRPLLVVGPRASHAAELVDRYEIGWCVDHDDHTRMIAAIEEVLETPADVLGEMGYRASRAIDNDFSRQALCGDFCDEVETSLARGQFFAAETRPTAVKAEAAPVEEDVPVTKPSPEEDGIHTTAT